MGGERVGEEAPSLEMAQVGLASWSARMLLEDGAERTRGRQWAAERTQQSGERLQTRVQRLGGAVRYGGEGEGRAGDGRNRAGTAGDVIYRRIL